MSYDNYCQLAAAESQLIREHQVAKRRIEITNIINKKIEIETFSTNEAQSSPSTLVLRDTIKLKLRGDGHNIINIASWWDMDQDWANTGNSKCMKKPVLFLAIDQKNYISDELYLFLCISDVLMECLFNDLFKKKEFEKQIKLIIEAAFNDLAIQFEFFKLIADVIPYMHVFAKYIFLFMQQLKAEGLSLQFFSTSSIEKKTMISTTMEGENKEQSVVYNIMSFENRHLFYLTNNTSKKTIIQNINAYNKKNFQLSWSNRLVNFLY
ncbi:13802_t:CDS:2 [Cetraspora pellucida]|uniref:13802_t:CDS:1 n=1 Tax=Cetraspora pellucida TaxID=1433469 RepID=A0A9N9HSF0_9GLOM|nr:13802_t:CDS:2 [Cetraspora pellucida]